tara:strand:- start:7 stop:792 length:786 start_codon:yes stop_codon:yes gene_type:complete
MAEKTDPMCDVHMAEIESDDRIVVLARTIQARDPEVEEALMHGAVDWRRLGETCLGQSLYRHRTVYQGASEAPIWSHLELSYFRGVVPAEAILDLVVRQERAGMVLLRAEILLTTPSSFVLPRDWQGSADRPERHASLEYIHVKPAYLGEYRQVMRDYCGPAASKLVRSGKFGTFRAMETAAVLHQDPELKIDWNQIHLCELEINGFHGFGREFEAALRDGSSGAAETTGVFAGLDRMRTVPRWTFNDPVAEEDTAVARAG